MSTRHRLRRRITGALFVGNVFASTAYIAAITISAIAAEALTGSPHLAGIPNALGTLGATFGATILTALSRRRGRLFAFPLGFAISALGGAIAASSLPLQSLAALLGGMFLIGFGRSIALLARFAAGDLWPRRQRASAIGFVVWAATFGSVIGPLFIVPTSRLGAIHFGAEVAGPFAFSALAFALASLWYFGTLRPEPLTLVIDESEIEEEEELEGKSTSATVLGPQRPTAAVERTLLQLIRLPEVQLPLLVLMSTQFVMIFLMTMMPLHVREHHHGLAMVSGVMMMHSLGMYAIAPLTGYLVDRLGARPMIACGGLLLIVSAILAAGSGDALPVPTTLSLFLLGVGWNFCFVSASAVLQKDLPLHEALRLQGVADSITWASGGLGAVSSGFVMAAWSFQGMAYLGLGISLIPWLALWRARKLQK